MDIKFYGGVNQIGGNKILVTDKKADASVFLDFGMNFTVDSRYFEEFIQPRTSNGAPVGQLGSLNVQSKFN